MGVIDTFLRYSLAHGRAVRLILLQDGVMAARVATVLALEGGQVTLRGGSRGKPFRIPRDCILSASYARGDKGQMEGAAPR